MTAVKTDIISRIFKRDRNKLIAFIRQKVSQDETAEDLLQDVLSKALMEQNVFEGVNHFVRWLYRSINNKVIDFYRKKRLKESSLDKTIGDDNATLHDIISDYSFDTEDELIQSMVSDAIDKAIEELPEEQRVVFIRNELEGKSFKELSEETGVPINTLLARKRYAVLKLRKKLQRLKKFLSESH